MRENLLRPHLHLLLLGKEKVAGDVAYRVRCDAIEDGADDATNEGDEPSKVDDAFGPELGEKTKADRFVDAYDDLAGDLIDQLLR